MRRLVLIKSVLQSCYIYWARIFGLPGKIVRHIESIMAHFLWAGPDLSKKMHTIGWDSIYKSYNEGGLNIKKVKEMNDACVLKHLWWIASNKDNLWVKWVHKKYLKHESTWTFRPPNDCSWIWQKISKVRDRMEPHVLHIIRDGRDTRLWLDQWHCDGILVKLSVILRGKAKIARLLKF